MICKKCSGELAPKKGHVDENGNVMVTWICRECGRRAQTCDGVKEPKSSPLDDDAFDWFFKDVFGLERVAKSGSETLPKSGIE